MYVRYPGNFPPCNLTGASAHAVRNSFPLPAPLAARARKLSARSKQPLCFAETSKTAAHGVVVAFSPAAQEER